MSSNTKTGGREATKGTIPGRLALSVGRPDLPEPEGFSWRSLSAVARLESGHTPARSHSEYWGGDVPWIGIRDATGNHGRTINETLDSVTQDGLDNSSARLLPEGTVCLSRTASVGFVVQMGRPMATSQDFVNWVCGPELNAAYLRYVLMLEQKSIRERFARGSTHQTMYYPEAKAMHILAPERKEQDGIVDVLSALEKKVYLNESVVEKLLLLEAAEAQRLIGGAVRFGRLGDQATVVKGVSYRSSDLVESSTTAMATLKSITRLGRYSSVGLKGFNGDYRQAQVVEEGDIAVAQTDLTQQAEVIGWAVRVPRSSVYERLVASLDLCLVKPFGKMQKEYLLAVLRQPAFREHCLARSSGTTVLHLARGAIESYDIPVADEEARSKYSLQAFTRFKLSDSLQLENERLTRTRDELSMLLLSGRLRVRDAEKVAEEVL